MFERSAVVLFKDLPAGVLAETPAGTRFTYNDAWSCPIAISMPIERREYSHTGGMLPFFQHLNAEGWLRERQARAGRVDQEDDFGLLLKYGRDCIGAVGVVPESEPNEILEDSLYTDTNTAPTSKRTISGVQRKLLVYNRDGIFTPSTSGSPATHIAKLNGNADEEIVRNEALTLRIATALLGKQHVTEFELGRVEHLNEEALLVKRFDRTMSGDKLRLEDFAQILNISRGQDFKGKYESSYEAIGTALDKFSARPKIDKDLFFKMCVTNFILGNADAHLKNFSMLEDRSGLMRLSPAYDIVNTMLYGGKYDQISALRLTGRNIQIEEITRDDLIKFGLSLGLPHRALAFSLSTITKAYENCRIIHEMHNSDFLTGYMTVVQNNALRMLFQ